MTCLLARAEANSPATAASLHVFFSDGAEPVVVPPGARLWVDVATTASFEWLAGDGDATVTATAGRESWPFVAGAADHRARLVATDALRDAWERDGTLTVSCGAAGAVVLRARPRRIEWDADGEDFEAPQRTATPLPGSRGFVEVVLDDITGGQVRLSLRTVAGRTLAEERSVSVGDAVEFEFGGESFAIRVERLTNHLIGQDSADLALRRGAAASAKSELEIAAREAERALDAAASDLERADGLVEGGKEPAGAAFEAIRRAHETARQALLPAPSGGLAIGEAGTTFPSTRIRARPSRARGGASRCTPARSRTAR